MAAKVTRKQAETVHDIVAAFLGVPAEDVFLADHTHENLSKGSWSIAFEGDYDWPHRFTEAQYANRTVPSAVFIEPLTGWGLGLHPA